MSHNENLRRIDCLMKLNVKTHRVPTSTDVPHARWGAFCSTFWVKWTRGVRDGGDSRVCFRITIYSYEYVKWLNRENGVQIQRERDGEKLSEREAGENDKSITLLLNLTVLSQSCWAHWTYLGVFSDL